MGRRLCAHHSASRPMYFRKKTTGGRTYLQIVHARREGSRIRQQVIATLGRLDELAASGPLERLPRLGARFAAKAMVLAAAQDGTASEIDVRRLGPALVFERLWAETGCQAVIEALAGQRKHGFALERAVFVTVLHRLMGSDLAAERWRTRYEIAGTEGPGPHQLHRTMAWAGGGGAGRAHAFCPALHQGRGGGAAVRRPARPAVEPRAGVHGHHQPVLRGRRRPDPGPARL